MGMKKTTLILSQKDISRLIDIKKAVGCVEQAFAAYARKETLMPSKIYITLPEDNGDFRAMPAYVRTLRACSLKWVNVHPDNAGKGLPTVMATLILSDPKTGYPLSVMDATLLTSLRTAAAGGVAAKYLARGDSSVVGLVGCGAQAVTQLQALRALFKIKEARVWGHKDFLIKEFIKKMRIRGETMIPAKTVRDCAVGADIITTTTPSRKTLIKLSWVKPGAHINAIGADAAGKRELETALLKKARVVIDDWAQAAHSGEINVPVKRKQISRRDICAELGEVVIGRKKGRRKDTDITVFDSTGLAIQDTAVAHMVYRAALRRKAGRKVELL